jgi:hypothetical protein
MVVHGIDLKGVPVLPAKADSPLVVDADAPLTFPVASQFLQSVAWRCSQVGDACRSIKHPKLTESNSLERTETIHLFAVIEPLCVPAGEGADQGAQAAPI